MDGGIRIQQRSVPPRTEKLITTQVPFFLEHAVESTVQCLDPYRKRKGNKAISIWENFYASLAVVCYFIHVEATLNRIAHLHKRRRRGFQYNPIGSTVLDKFHALFGPEHPINTPLLEAAQTRNAIVHAYIWQEKRRYSNDWFELLSVRTFRPRELKSFRKEYQRHVNMRLRRTRTHGFNVIPTRVNLLDAYMTMLIILRLQQVAAATFGHSDARGFSRGILLHNPDVIGAVKSWDMNFGNGDGLNDFAAGLKSFLKLQDKKQAGRLYDSLNFSEKWEWFDVMVKTKVSTGDLIGSPAAQEGT